MKYLLARPYPDELLGSVWIRTVRRLQVPISVLTKAVTGGAKFRPGLFHLGYLREMSSSLRVPPRWLLWNHTVFPYTTAFYSPELREKAVASVMSTGPVARKVGPIVQSVSGNSRLRRFCILCARHELELSGETYWHREHNLPGVRVCLRHQRMLQVTELPTMSTRWLPQLPEDFVSGVRGAVRSVSAPSEFLLQLAQASSFALRREPFKAWHRDAAWYREAVETLGLVSFDRSVDEAKLADWLEGHIGDVAALDLSSNDQTLRWAAHLLRPGYTAPFVSFKHLIFESAMRLQTPLRQPILNHVPLGFRGFATRDADERFARTVRRLVRRYLALGERVRVADILEEAGCWSRFRHTRKLYPAVEKEVARLKESAVAARPNWGKGQSRLD